MAVAALIQAGFGVYQSVKGSQAMKKLGARPEFEIPEEINANLTDDQKMSLQGLPEEQKRQFVENMDRSSQFGLNALTSRKAGTSGIASLSQTMVEGGRNLMLADSQARDRNRGNLRESRREMAKYKLEERQKNVIDPYNEKKQAAQDLLGAGIQNAFTGIKGLESSAEMLATGGMSGAMGGGGGVTSLMGGGGSESSFNPGFGSKTEEEENFSSGFGGIQKGFDPSFSYL